MSVSNLISYNINSKNKISGTDENFNIQIDIPNNLKNVLNMVSITQICIPKSFYMVQNGFNNLHLYEEVIGSGNKQLINIVIPPGNYKKTEFYKKLGTLMTSSSLNNITYTITDEQTDYDTGKCKITATNTNVNKYLNFLYGDIYELIGFNKNTEYDFIDNIVSINIINFNRENNLYLKSNCCNSDNNNLFNGANTLCVVYSGGNKDFSYIINQYRLKDNMKPLVLNNTLNFYLCNEDGEQLYLNGVDMSFVINFFTYTPNKRIYDKINNFIDFNLIKD